MSREKVRGMIGILATLIFLAAQTHALGHLHLHADELAEVDCAVCVHADAAPIVDAADVAADESWQSPTKTRLTDQSGSAEPALGRYARAPPTTST